MKSTPSQPAKKAKPSATPLYDSLHHDAIDRLLSDKPGFEGTILKGHLLIERAVDILIDGSLKHPKRLREGRRLTFDLKLALADALGVLPKEHASAIKGLNALRNAIAHREGYALTIRDVMSLRLDWDAKIEARIKLEFAKDPADAIADAIPILVWTCFELVDTFERQHRPPKPP